ncbi:hypothetical protein ACN082_00515 [Rothia sp. CCM 9417]|uniref:hypothetical protein n=1 Tax=Rothia sp. CCM 9417 TaxID=3402657 RepID=UPI003AE8BC6F
MTNCSIPLSALSSWVDDLETDSQKPQLTRHIDSCPECDRKVASLHKLHSLASQDFDHEVKELEKDLSWAENLLSNLVLEAKAGRSIPLPSPHQAVRIRQDEGAVVAAVRAVADELDEVIIGQCRLEGDIETPGAPVKVNVTASVQIGLVIPDLAQALRSSIQESLERCSKLNIVAINITIQDLHEKSLND